MEVITSWERKGRAEGLREGRAEGLREGRAEGLREGQRLVVERKRLTICLRIPPLSTHKGSRGSLGVLMPETRDGTQQLPKKPTPVSPQAGDYMAKTGCAA